MLDTGGYPGGIFHNLYIQQGADLGYRGWLIPNLLMLPEVLAICELASSMPVNGAFYWWTGALVPPKWSHFVSYLTGWLNLLSMFTATAAFAYAVASSFAYSVTIAVPTMEWTDPQLMAISMGVTILWAALMSLKLESIGIIYVSMGGLMKPGLSYETCANRI